MQIGQPMLTDLRILATTDIHMHIFAYDYYADRVSERFGLISLQVGIDAQKATATNSLLFDNGDSLQGNPMAEYLAGPGRVLHRKSHPMIAAMNALGYDAACVGNHDFSYGIEFLRQTLPQARFPFTAANIRHDGLLPLPAHLLLTRDLTGRDGKQRQIRIGVIGLLPPQTAEWEPHLQGRIGFHDMVSAAQREARLLRKQGADLVIALAHTGISAQPPPELAENAATAVANLPEIDVIIAGHTHRVFPSDCHPSGVDIDPQRGTLAGKPAVMAGFWGSHLGVINLVLTGGGDVPWQIADFDCTALPAETESPPQSSRPKAEKNLAISTAAIKAHQGTLKHFRSRIGHSQHKIDSFFSLIGDDPALRLVMQAQRWHLRRLFQHSRWRHLPILSAAAPFRTGARGGPDHFTNVPAGPITLRNLMDIYHFPNRLCAFLVTGQQLHDWLERAASLFLRLTPGLQDQPLINPDFPGYNFDTIEGLNWQIDLTQPARHCPDGRMADPQAQRIRTLTYRGAPLQPDQQFVLVTNGYRRSASGFYGPLTQELPLLHSGNARIQDLLRRYIERRTNLDCDGHLGWSFAPLPDSSAVFDTSPMAAERVARLPFRTQPMGLQADGFFRLRLYL